MSGFFNCCKTVGWLRGSLGILGIVPVMFFLLWLLAGWVGWVPTMVEWFGVAGMRTPASISIAGLMLAAVSFQQC